MEPEKQSRFARMNEFIARHKTALTVATTATITSMAVAGLQKSALREAYDFIDAAGLTEKFLNSVPAEEIYS